MKATAVAHANIALVKYWGKRDDALVLPEAASLSVALDRLLTTTSVELEAAEDSLRIDGRNASGFVIAGGFGAAMDLGDRMFASLGGGFQKGYQKLPSEDLNAKNGTEFVRITLVLGTQNDAVVVPSQAVMQGQQGTYVLVVNNDGTATSQPITVQRTLDSLSVIAGVPAGALVVTDGQLRLTPNAKVDIRGGPTTETAGGGGAGTNGAETTR